MNQVSGGQVAVPALTRGQFNYDDPNILAHTQAIEKADADHARKKELIEMEQRRDLQGKITWGLLITGGACLAMLLLAIFWSSTPPAIVTIAGSLLSAIISGSVAYAFGSKK